MTYKNICIAEKITGMVDSANHTILIILACIVAAPFMAFYVLCKWGYKLTKKIWHHYRHREEYTAEEKHEKLISMYANREISTACLPHSYAKSRQHRQWENPQFFFEKREYTIPHFCIVYVENEYNDRMHRFFDERRDLIEKWEAKHGWQILFVDKDTIKEGMFFPQDYDEHFNHGFLYNASSSSYDPEFHIYGHIHHYYEVNPTTDDDIARQMDIVMSNIYHLIERMIV